MSENVKVIKKTHGATESKEMKIERKTSPDFRSIYVNNVQISVTYFDIKVLLGEVSGLHDDRLEVLDRGAILMSPEHAAAFHRLLGEQLELYKQSFGDLRPAPSAKVGQSK